MSLNTDILDFIVRHQVGLMRFGSAMIEEIMPILEESEKEIIEKIRDLGDTASDFSKRRLEAQLKAIQGINKEAAAALNDKLEADLTEFTQYESDFTIKAIETPAPFALDLVAPSAEQLAAAVVNDPLQGKYLKEWTTEWGQSRHMQVRNQMRLGYVEGETIDQIVRRIKGTKAQGYKDGVLDISRRSAKTLVRTAVNDLSNTARNMVYEKNTDVIAEWMFVATLDSRTTITCASLDGKTFPVGEGPMPPRHPNCRSTTVPVTKTWRELGLDVDEADEGVRASVDGEVPAAQKYDAWLDRQPVATQNEVLGETRAQLFRKGDLPIDRMVDSFWEPLSLAELRKREAAAFKKAGL